MMQKCILEAIPSASYGLEFKEFFGKIAVLQRRITLE